MSNSPTVCRGCGTAMTPEEILAGGFLSCCPERKMVTASEICGEANSLQVRIDGALVWLGKIGRSEKFAVSEDVDRVIYMARKSLTGEQA